MTLQEIAHITVAERFSYQNELELEIALRRLQNFFDSDLKHKENKVIVEIGIANAATLSAWKEAFPEVAVIGIDPLQHQRTPEQLASFDKLIAQYKPILVPNWSHDEEAHSLLTKYLAGNKVDFLFIDGDHRIEGVTYDFDNYLQYMGRPSIIGFHDIYHNQVLYDAGSRVREVWERAKQQYDYDYDEWHFRTSMGFGFLYLK